MSDALSIIRNLRERLVAHAAFHADGESDSLEMVAIADAAIERLQSPTPQPGTIAIPDVPGIWAWPTDVKVVTQRYGAHPDWPAYARLKPPGHEGLDIRTGKRGRVYAALAGRVKVVGWHNGSIEKREGPYGWHLRTISRNTRDGHVYECVYAHFEPESTRRYTEPNEPPLKLGDLVRTGDHIAFSGLTGNIDGEHLHLSVKRDGVLIDPEPLFAEILK